MIKKMKNNKGFTLTELIVVIVIIGILAAVLVPSLTSYINKARVAAATQEASNALTELRLALTVAEGEGTEVTQVSDLDLTGDFFFEEYKSQVVTGLYFQLSVDGYEVIEAVYVATKGIVLNYDVLNNTWS